MRFTRARIQEVRDVALVLCVAVVGAVGCESSSSVGEGRADLGAADASPRAPITEVACAPGDRAVQRHGARCLCCHSDEFSFAGSVDARGGVAQVTVTDARGETRKVAPNLFGNFFGHFPLTPPFRASVTRADGRVSEMRADAPHADCNACHAAGGPTRPIGGAGLD
jgi:hypothetical protein